MNFVRTAAIPQAEATQDGSEPSYDERFTHGFGEVAVAGLRMSKSRNAR
jgi:hypothetical protein